MPSDSNQSHDNSGILLVDKPSGMTSHDVVDAIRRCYRTRRVGHSGTLDPLASGLLIIMIGSGTKIARYMTGLDKTYRATMRLGWTSTTGDADGELSVDGDPATITTSKLSNAIAAHTGTLSQRIPLYAAVRSDGKRRYEMARAGEDVPEMHRETTVHAFELISWNPPDADVRIHCASGTYIRSLAESVGADLKCGGYLTALRRERIGESSIDDAIPLGSFEKGRETDAPVCPPRPEPVEKFLMFPRLVLKDESVGGVIRGLTMRASHIAHVSAKFNVDSTVVLADREGHALAVGRALRTSDEIVSPADNDAVFRYERVLT